MDYTNSPKNNLVPNISNFLFLERMYGNVEGTSRCDVNTVNGTEGLYCSSSSADTSDIFKQRVLTKNDELDEEEFSLYAKLISSELIQSVENSKTRGRYLEKNQYEEIRGQKFANGVRIVSTFRLS